MNETTTIICKNNLFKGDVIALVSESIPIVNIKNKKKFIVCKLKFIKENEIKNIIPPLKGIFFIEFILLL